MAGVRQGGVISPALFSVYLDGLITKLAGDKLGICYGNQYLGCFLYADDIILLSLTLKTLQNMLDVCVIMLRDLDLLLLISKSSFSRVGARCNNPIIPPSINNDQ